MTTQILAIDPDRVDRLLLRRMVPVEYKIVTLSSAIEAILFAKHNSFDVAIINQKISNRLDGIMLLHVLRQFNDSFIPFATTAIYDEATAQILRAAGFQDVAEKPLSEVAIAEMIRKTKLKSFAA